MMLARALELTCREENVAACGLRFSLPGLPDEPVTQAPPSSKTGDQVANAAAAEAAAGTGAGG